MRSWKEATIGTVIKTKRGACVDSRILTAEAPAVIVRNNIEKGGAIEAHILKGHDLGKAVIITQDDRPGEVEKIGYLYFAYGSNLNKARMKWRCRKAKPLYDGTLKDYKMTFRGNTRGCGVANIEKEPGRNVPGGLWIITDECLEALDRYEGFPHLYTREWIDIQVCGADWTLPALTYIMTPGKRIAPPGDEYAAIIMEGYCDFNLEPEEFVRAITESRK